jgi:septum formation inhibitor-activating ATPase MinD
MTSYQGQKVLRTADIEASIRYPITATIAEDNALVTMTINRGKPLLMSHPSSLIAKDIVSLAKKVVGTQQKNLRVPLSPEAESVEQPETPGKKTKSGRRFFWQTVTQVFR